MKKLIYLICMIFLVASFVDAEVQTLGTFKKDSIIGLKQIASGFTSCNITSVLYPDSTCAICNNVGMTKNNNEYNQTFNKTSKLGEYIVNGYCTDGDEDTVWSYNFEITPSGFSALGVTGGLTLTLAIISILIIAILFFIFSFKVVSFPSKLIFMGLSLILFVIVFLFIMISLGQILGGYESLINSYSSFFWVAGFLLVLVFIFLMLCLMKRVIELFKIKRGLM